MIAELATCLVVLLAAAAEVLHGRRCRRIGMLAFGPHGRPAAWAYLAPLVRIAGVGGTCWGLITLLLLEPKVHKAGEIPESEFRHLLLVLDVSPSMRLEDAGPAGKQSRMKRAGDLLTSFFERVPIELYRTTVVAVYTEAKPVVVDTRDLEVVRNILYDLPMHHAFTSGSTNLFAGLDEAAKIAKPWRPGSTTLLVVSDGDTVPATGMPKLPVSVAHVVVVGVGDPLAGKFIDGHQSRQNMSTLRQVAVRLGGSYHNGNEKHLPTDLLRQLTLVSGRSKFERLTRREYALLTIGLGASVLAFLPLALHFGGTRWRPGAPLVAMDQRYAATSDGFPTSDHGPPRLLAWLALVLPLLAWLSQILMVVILRGAGPEIHLLAAALQLLLLLGGLALGILAVGGGWRHGGPGVMLPAVLGLVLSAGTLLVIVFLFLTIGFR